MINSVKSDIEGSIKEIRSEKEAAQEGVLFCFQQGEVVFGEDEGRGNRNEKLPSGRAWLPSCAHVRPSNSSSPVRHCIMSFNSVTSPARGVVTMKDRPTNVS